MGVFDAVWLANAAIAGCGVGWVVRGLFASRRTPPQNEVVGCCTSNATITDVRMTGGDACQP